MTAIAGQRIDQPVAGYYRHRPVRGGPYCGVRIWHGPPIDPVTGTELDRSLRWQAEINGDPVDFDRVWPQCTGTPITQAQYQRLCNRQRWARQYAPNSAFAEPGRKIDPLSATNPLPF